MIFDFIEGAAGREQASERNRRRFDALTLQPRVLGDVASRDLAANVLGHTFGLPVGIAPMGMCDLAWPGADRALAGAATALEIPICLSSAASSSIEEMRGWAGENAWFQLYVSGPPEQTDRMITRARDAGYATLILTADVPVVSRRVRDLRNGFTAPLKLGPRQLLDFALHPAWSVATLRAGVPSPKNYILDDGRSGFDRSASRAGADWAFLDRLRERWPGRLVVKGVTSADDARRIRAAGADAIYVSTHGGRQLDSAPAAIDLLPSIRHALGPDYPLIFDSGLRGGEDVVKALALGADLVMLGRPLLLALGADGARGLRAYLDGLAEDISVAMAQIGQTRIDGITGDVLYSPNDTETSGD